MVVSLWILFLFLPVETMVQTWIPSSLLVAFPCCFSFGLIILLITSRLSPRPAVFTVWQAVHVSFLLNAPRPGTLHSIPISFLSSSLLALSILCLKVGVSLVSSKCECFAFVFCFLPCEFDDLWVFTRPHSGVWQAACVSFFLDKLCLRAPDLRGSVFPLCSFAFLLYIATKDFLYLFVRPYFPPRLPFAESWGLSSVIQM